MGVLKAFLNQNSARTGPELTVGNTQRVAFVPSRMQEQARFSRFVVSIERWHSLSDSVQDSKTSFSCYGVALRRVEFSDSVVTVQSWHIVYMGWTHKQPAAIRMRENPGCNRRRPRGGVKTTK